MNKAIDSFSRLAEEYDAWFDSPRGRRLFELELGALKLLLPGSRGRWLEVGTGTGRFARELNIEEGVEPAAGMGELAASRGLRVIVGRGEDLPCLAESYDGILLVAVVCFLENPVRVFRECRRVLKPGGVLILGFIPSLGSWGREYARRARAGDRFYARARFYSPGELEKLAAAGGFLPAGAASCLYDPPDRPLRDMSILPGADPAAGFGVLKLLKPERSD